MVYVTASHIVNWIAWTSPVNITTKGFRENCIRVKKNWTRMGGGVRVPSAPPLDKRMLIYHFTNDQSYYYKNRKVCPMNHLCRVNKPARRRVPEVDTY